MKKTVLALALVLGLSTAAFAGPLVGLSFAPAVNSIASVYFGWQSENGWAASVAKTNLNTWQGDWTLGALWTPKLWNSVNLRAGGSMTFNWTNRIQYKGLSLLLGAEKWITDQVGVYGQLNLSSQLQFTPVIGVEINFWMPSANEAPSG